MNVPESTTSPKANKTRSSDNISWSYDETEVLLGAVEKFSKIIFRYGSIITHPKHAIDYILDNNLIQNKSRQNIFMKYKNLMRTYRKIYRKNSKKNNFKYYEPDRFPFFHKIHAIVMKYQGPECIGGLGLEGTEIKSNEIIDDQVYDEMGDNDDSSEIDAEMAELIAAAATNGFTGNPTMENKLTINGYDNNKNDDNTRNYQTSIQNNSAQISNRIFIELEEKCTQTSAVNKGSTNNTNLNTNTNTNTNTNNTFIEECNNNLNNNNNIQNSINNNGIKNDEQCEYFRAKTEYFKIKAQTERGKLLAMKKFIEIEEKKLEILEKLAEHRDNMNIIRDSNDETLEDIIKHLL